MIASVSADSRSRGPWFTIWSIGTRPTRQMFISAPTQSGPRRWGSLRISVEVEGLSVLLRAVHQTDHSWQPFPVARTKPRFQRQIDARSLPSVGDQFVGLNRNRDGSRPRRTGSAATLLTVVSALRTFSRLARLATGRCEADKPPAADYSRCRPARVRMSGPAGFCRRAGGKFQSISRREFFGLHHHVGMARSS